MTVILSSERSGEAATASLAVAALCVATGAALHLIARSLVGSRSTSACDLRTMAYPARRTSSRFDIRIIVLYTLRTGVSHLGNGASNDDEHFRLSRMRANEPQPD